MNTMAKVILSIAFIASVMLQIAAFKAGDRTKKRFKKALAFNIFLFALTLVFTTLFAFSGSIYAADSAAASGGISTGLGYIAAALSVGLACIGGGVAVSAAASAALGAVSEDSSIFGRSLVFIGLAEGVCIYGVVIAVMILGRL